MKIPYDEPSIRISLIITDREHIYRWGRTHRSHERFSRRNWGPSWRYRRSVGCITATNNGRPEKRESTRLRAASPQGSEISVRTVLTCTRVHCRISFAKLRQARDLLTLSASPRGMASEAGHTEFSLGTKAASCAISTRLSFLTIRGASKRSTLTFTSPRWPLRVPHRKTSNHSIFRAPAVSRWNCFPIPRAVQEPSET